MENRNLKNSIKFFGASLDALDHQEAVSIKRSYLGALLAGKSLPLEFRDPYDLFRKLMGNSIKEFGHENLGRFIVDSWLTPRPQISDLDLITAEGYLQFLKNNGFQVYSSFLKDFVKTHVFPYIPGMIGVDHSLTGGVLMSLSERLGPENMGLLIFDAHTDAIPLPLRSGLVQYAREMGLPSPGPLLNSEGFDFYTTGNFLFHLIEKEIILPKNLIIIGPADSVESLRDLRDQRVREYVCHYDSLEDRGIKIISRNRLQRLGPALIQHVLEQLQCSQLYISLDVDVSAQCGVLATRFIDLVGTETTLILEAVLQIAEFLSSGRFSLVGLDIMEVDIYKIGAKLESGVEDRTGEFIQKFISILLPTLYNKMN